MAVDGYLSGSTVFYDADGDGVQDEGEVSATTGADGSFKLLGVTQTANGRLIVEDGKDILTGKMLDSQLVSNSNLVTGVVVSPLTSLLASGISPADLKAVLDLPASVDLASFDPVAALNSGNAVLAQAGESVLMVAQQVFTVMSTLVAQGATPAAAAKSLALALPGSVSLEAAVNGLVNPSTAAALNGINAAIAQAFGPGELASAFLNGAVGKLTQIMKPVVVAQTTFIDAVEAAQSPVSTDLASLNSELASTSNLGLSDYADPAALAAIVAAARVELSTEMLSFLSSGGFTNFAGAQFDPTIGAEIGALFGTLFSDVNLDDLGLEVVGCL